MPQDEAMGALMNLLEVLGDLCSALFLWPSQGRKSNRVFSPAFVAICIIFATLELVLLHSIFDVDAHG